MVSSQQLNCDVVKYIVMFFSNYNLFLFQSKPLSTFEQLCSLDGVIFLKKTQTQSLQISGLCDFHPEGLCDLERINLGSALAAPASKFWGSKGRREN